MRFQNRRFFFAGAATLASSARLICSLFLSARWFSVSFGGGVDACLFCMRLSESRCFAVSGSVADSGAGLSADRCCC